MAAGTARAEFAVTKPLAFGRVVVVGGGCYGSYYVRQLRRARSRGAVTIGELIVVDQDPACIVARDGSPGLGGVLGAFPRDSGSGGRRDCAITVDAASVAALVARSRHQPVPAAAGRDRGAARTRGRSLAAGRG